MKKILIFILLGVMVSCRSTDITEKESYAFSNYLDSLEMIETKDYTEERAQKTIDSLTNVLSKWRNTDRIVTDSTVVIINPDSSRDVYTFRREREIVETHDTLYKDRIRNVGDTIRIVKNDTVYIKEYIQDKDSAYNSNESEKVTYKTVWWQVVVNYLIGALLIFLFYIIIRSKWKS